ncbi:hypothetical protein [Acidovorax sp. 1608163]
MSHCPFCGANLPASKRNSWFSVDFTRFNRHLSRSKLNWRVRNEESAIPG